MTLLVEAVFISGPPEDATTGTDAMTEVSSKLLILCVNDIMLYTHQYTIVVVHIYVSMYHNTPILTTSMHC